MVKSFFSFIVCLFLASCQNSPPLSNKPLVLVSIAPYQFLVERVAGPYVEVQTIVPSSSNPHTFEPTASQVYRLAAGTIWFQIGEPFEGKMAKVLQEKNSDLWTQDLRNEIDLLPETSSHECHHCAADHLDRHIWMSPKLAATQVEQIASGLSDRFPEYRKEFEQNGQTLVQELLELDKEIHGLLKNVSKRHLLVSHPAFGYFCREYGLEQLSIESEGKDPRPHHLEQILQQAIEGSIEFSLALPQYNNKGAQFIAEKLHIPVKWIDPYSHDYFELMHHLTQLIASQNNE